MIDETGKPETTLLCKRIVLDVWAAAIINYIPSYSREIRRDWWWHYAWCDIILPYLKEQIDDRLVSPEKIKLG